PGPGSCPRPGESRFGPNIGAVDFLPGPDRFRVARPGRDCGGLHGALRKAAAAIRASAGTRGGVTMSIEIVLLERVPNLGQMGDVVKVRPGYARNYLLPQKKALRASKASLEQFERQRAQLEATNLERRSEAESLATKIDGMTVTLIRQAGDSGQLYGSVSVRDLAEAMQAANVEVDRKQVRLDQPIKQLGLHPVTVVLH